MVRFSAMRVMVAAAAVDNNEGYLPASVVGLSLELAAWRRPGVGLGRGLVLARAR